MKKYTVLLTFIWIFSTVQAGESAAMEELPEFFCLTLWEGVWKKYKEQDAIHLKDDASPFLITTFIALWSNQRQLESHVRCLDTPPVYPYVILKIKTDALCKRHDIPHTFSKDRFGYYRLNATIIPREAISDVRTMDDPSIFFSNDLFAR